LSCGYVATIGDTGVEAAAELRTGRVLSSISARRLISGGNSALSFLISFAASLPSAGRRPESLSRQRTRKAATSGGRLAPSGISALALMTAQITPPLVSAKGRLPVSISKSTTPSAQTSELGDSSLARICSGDI